MHDEMLVAPGPAVRVPLGHAIHKVKSLNVSAGHSEQVFLSMLGILPPEQGRHTICWREREREREREIENRVCRVV